MRTHTSDFKNALSGIRQVDNKITYTINEETQILSADNIFKLSKTTNSDLLKTVMKTFEFESDLLFDKETIFNLKSGLLVNGNYEYIDYGDYVLKDEPEYDINSKRYTYTCYDKMLYTMVDYVRPQGLTFPVTVRDYITTLANACGLDFAKEESIFVNYNKTIKQENFGTENYTFRDIFDYLAQVVGGWILINENNQLDIKYPTETNETFNNDYLLNINVDFNKKYGPVNSLVFSRASGADNIYRQDQYSIETNGLCELKFEDNPLLGGNDRDEFIDGVFDNIKGLEFYIMDVDTIGLMFLDTGDLYNYVIENEEKKCIMLNDELDLSSGIKEKTYTEEPELTETDYKKADKTDRKINQTYLIVDKQNQVIEGVINQVSEQNETIAEIRLQYNELLSRISDIADITTSGESSYASVNLLDINASQPIEIKIRPILESISYLYPNSNLFPSSTLYSKSRTLRFTNTETNETFDWELPTNLWYYNNTIYDELELSYGDGSNSSVIVTRKCKINADGTISALATPTTEIYQYPSYLILTDGDYTVQLLGYTNAYLYVQLVAKNIYTTQFYTKAETNTLIDQTARDITIEANEKFTTLEGEIDENTARIIVNANGINSLASTKVGSNEIISKINQSAEEISINANKIKLEGYTTINDGFKIDLNGNIEANGGIIAGWNITGSYFQKTIGNYSFEIRSDRASNQPALLIYHSTEGYKWYVRPDGYMYASNVEITGGSISINRGNYYFNMGVSTGNPNVSGLNVGGYGVKAYSGIVATGFGITDSDSGKSGTFILRHSNGINVVYLTFTGGILTAYNIV